MRRVTAAIAACLLVGAAAGCGSSGAGTSSGASSGAGTGSGASTAATASASGLRPSTTPKYASPPASQPVLGGSVDVAYRNITIRPDTLRVKVGTKIRWTNYDSVEHNVTSRGGPQHFASPSLAEGATFTILASHPGLIRYECTIHPTTMNGTIEVVR